MSMEIEACTDESLTMLWEHFDLKTAEEKLAVLQYELNRAASRTDDWPLEAMHTAIGRDLAHK